MEETCCLCRQRDTRNNLEVCGPYWRHNNCAVQFAREEDLREFTILAEQHKRQIKESRGD